MTELNKGRSLKLNKIKLINKTDINFLFNLIPYC